jgi:hypothetical protein
MNTMNRALIVILLLVAIVLCSVLLVAPVRVLGAVAQQSVALVDFLNSMRTFVRVGLGILFAAVLDIILVLFLIAEVRRPAQKAIRVKKTSGGEVQVSVNSPASCAPSRRFWPSGAASWSNWTWRRQPRSTCRRRPSKSSKRPGGWWRKRWGSNWLVPPRSTCGPCLIPARPASPR